MKFEKEVDKKDKNEDHQKKFQFLIRIHNQDMFSKSSNVILFINSINFLLMEMLQI